ncbi:MAG: hypothetical protein ACJAVV_002037 [Alphaproteobacteria bacterium]
MANTWQQPIRNSKPQLTIEKAFSINLYQYNGIFGKAG